MHRKRGKVRVRVRVRVRDVGMHRTASVESVYPRDGVGMLFGVERPKVGKDEGLDVEPERVGVRF